MSVSIKAAGSEIRVSSSYSPAFVVGAKRLGGRWAAPNWVFDARDEQRVRELCIEIYGTDGAPTAICTLRVVYESGHHASADAIRLGGREIARAYGRDSGAKLGAGVVLLAGGFGSGGSMKNWTTKTHSETGATVLVRDVPVAMAERLIAELAANGIQGVLSIAVEPEAPKIDVAALTAERERLVARLAEIDRLLTAE